MKAFHGTIIHSPKLGEIEILENALLLVADNGRIEAVEPRLDRDEVPIFLQSRGLHPRQGNTPASIKKDADSKDDAAADVHYLARTQFLVPGFVDTHNHAPQWGMRGLGQGLHILDWLDRITFPHEARFADPGHARRVYARCVDGFLRQGVTTASYYGSRHAAATDVLADLCLEKGQRALVGKCNMDRNAPDTYRDADAAESLRDTEACIAHVRARDPDGRLLQYVLTPRFAITCTPPLLRGLGDIAARESAPQAQGGMAIQTHFNEAEQEMTSTRALFPEFRDEVELYAHFGLLTPRTILAHCCYASESELDRLRQLGCGVAHCPVSNMTVGGGFMAAPVRAFLDRGIPVGLGTDSGGGFSSSMLDAMRQAIVASNAREVQSGGALKGLSIPEVFHLATLGGAKVCGLGDKVGTLEVGKEFDAILVNADPARPGIMTMVEDEDSLGTVFEKFVMTGDDRNIEQVFVRGRQVKS
ncbi:Guanine deaminase [Apiospora kogelbergensis]|uniref:Guanine deaminase n=1 Tax=Apiospora kogelbergensis TaxID=1337665 RepID=A0AAW0QUC1_9PEZI